MKYTTVIGIFVSLMLVAAYASAPASQGAGGGAGGGKPQATEPARDRVAASERDRLRVQDRDQQRVHKDAATDMSDKDIYGSELMTKQERKQYREELQSAKNEQARQEVRARHEEQMRERALQQGKDLVPPGQGPVYGGELMTVQERNAYRERLRRFDSEDDRLKFQSQHREMMNQRAAALGVRIEEAE